ncbi:MAG TPA: DUF177 domain-containing protein [Thermoanaerobaculia bacterium]|nr:DUF177 domain-containing protein [Thermoanaerobaculia bacterium]
MKQDPIIDFDVIDKDGPQSYSGTFAFTPDDLEGDELEAVGPIAIEAHADKGNLPGEYEIEGTAQFSGDLKCSRCVEPYPFANSSTFHVRFRPRPQAPGESEEVEITDEGELDVEYYSERAVPLKNLALEQVQLAIPMKPLCDEKCLGLCPTCGANRNRESCNCEATVGDERWGALQGIREELAKKKES